MQKATDLETIFAQISALRTAVQHETHKGKRADIRAELCRLETEYAELVESLWK